MVKVFVEGDMTRVGLNKEGSVVAEVGFKELQVFVR